MNITISDINIIDNDGRRHHHMQYIDMGFDELSGHFLHSKDARGLSLAKVMRMSEEEAFHAFQRIRWAATNGEPTCPKCGCSAVYSITTRRRWKCSECLRQFSVTSDTIFASRKLPMRDILGAIAIFVNGAKGHSALQLSRDLDVDYKTAFVLAHKIREAMTSSPATDVGGHVEVDGAYFGGHVKPANRKVDRLDLRLAKHRTGKRQVVMVMRERGGKSLPFVAKSEAGGTSTIVSKVRPNSTIYADEASAYDVLHPHFDTKRINHSIEYANGAISTNQAESFFSRLRRAEIGTHHHIAGPYLQMYACEMAWREDHRRESNAEQFQQVFKAALEHPVSRRWKGYWQRAQAERLDK